eukprot:CAMPEP_0115485198 /NCGR_PEP_ID=MMETSP0271-20121206/59784_1 /TAXON_ID=71861 /ORGANISM="Scrippsiella trochoidea, Strain CCMP3099" /LENGTH=199 /DNA_ID=CAMNT_0002913145 /DNA_START=90 /DNA_END=686 /DNA_ORIENTATION=+
MSGFLGAYEDSSEEGDDAPSILVRAASAAAVAGGAAPQAADSAEGAVAVSVPAASSPATASASPAAAAAGSPPVVASPPEEGCSAPSSPSSDAGSGGAGGTAEGPVLPPSPVGEPDEEILERVRSLHELRKKGKSIRDHIQGSRDWSNPYILERVIKVFEIDEYGSNYPKEIFDPARIAEHPSDFFDAPECERPPPPKR